MDFGRVLDTVTRFLDARGFRYALVGAFALSAYGLNRATQDLDLAMDAGARRDNVAEIRKHFERHGLLARFDELRKILDAAGP